ncbi:SLC44A1 [Bugula neritina]|uniref:Choline transporter-like protein n=1 Tax=Bugula neritina TaxID=10212 RepID=A0A7J7IVG0_BUGNE|nr:SLC44A1 [Bugula neritina]
MGGCCCCPGNREREHPALGSPLKKRSCTDIPCFIVFFLYWGGMIGILVFSLVFGRVSRLLNGFDDYGNTCGVINNHPEFNGEPYTNQDMTGRPYQFFMNIYNLAETYMICVKECPTRELKDMSEVYQYYNETGTRLCNYNIDPKEYKSQKECDLSFTNCFGPCPAFPVWQQGSLFSRCLPQDIIDNPLNAVGLFTNSTVLSTFTQFFSQYRFFNELAASFYTVRYDILYLMLIALGLALILVFMLRFVIKIVVWFIVIVTALVAIGGTAALWVTYYRLQVGLDPQLQHTVPLIRIMVDARTAFLVYSIVATVFTVILLLVILVMRKRLQLAVALFQEAGRVLEHSPLILIQPVWTYLFQLIILVGGIIMLILCAGITDPVAVEDMLRVDANGTHHIYQFIDRPFVPYFWWYIVIGVVWMVEFANAIQQLVVAGTVAEWYFTRDKKSLSCILCKATSRTVLYHLGSAAFGSFLITLVRIPRYILMKVNQKIKDGSNECAKFMLKCCICCLYCLEKCLRYINRNAYIVIAISSTNFCVARVKAFHTLLSNVLRVLAINTVGDFVLFLGKVLVMATNVIIAFFMFDRHNAGASYGNKNLFFLPMLGIAIFSYLIAHCFLSSFEMLVDTLLLCFCEDVKQNDGTEEKPYYMSKHLMKFVANSSTAINKQKKVNVDEVDGVTESEKQVLSAGDDSSVAPEHVHLTENRS